MIDNPRQAERLLERIASSLPLTAMINREVAIAVREQSPGVELSRTRRCTITWVSYSGDEGGIVCRLGLGDSAGAKALFVSITQLIFDARSPLAREIAAYQKHRIKRLRLLS